jgi:hypothetical protein
MRNHWEVIIPSMEGFLWFKPVERVNVVVRMCNILSSTQEELIYKLRWRN